MIKKTQMKTKQNDNPDLHYANCNAKNVRKFLVNNFDSDHAIMLSCNDKYAVKIGVPLCSLALCPKTKVGWVVEAVEVITADHGTVSKSNLVPTVTFDTNVPKTTNLGHFYN